MGAADPPDGIWMLMDAILIFDQVKRQITAVAYADLSDSGDEDEAWDMALGRIQSLRDRMNAPLPAVDPLRWDGSAKTLPEVSSNRSQDEFEQAVLTAKERISA